MQDRKTAADDVTKPARSPNNLLDYIRAQSMNEDFFGLLARHHERLKLSLGGMPESEDLKNALFIIEMNGFFKDLLRISKTCFDIDNELSKRRKDLEICRKALQAYSSEELAHALRSFYDDARSYDKHFPSRHWYPKYDNRPFLPIYLFFNSPFNYNKELSNEENIFNLASAFRIHDPFFKNYLNVLYGDGEDGEEFVGRSFGAVSLEYEKVRGTVENILKIIPQPTPDIALKGLEQKRRLLDQIIEKYPATLYLATKTLLLHFEKSSR